MRECGFFLTRNSPYKDRIAFKIAHLDMGYNKILWTSWVAAQKMKFSIKDFVSKCEQIRISVFLRIWSHLREKTLTKNFVFCALLK